MSKYSDEPLCGPFAVSVIAEKEVEDVLDAFRSEFSKTTAWRGRSTLGQCIQILMIYGCKCKRIRPAGWHDYTFGSLRNWVNNHARPRGTYLVRVGGHILAVRGHRVYDQTQVDEVEQHWAYRKRVTHVFEMA